MPRNLSTILQCVIAGATAGLFAAGTNIAARYTSDASDVLGFIGGIIGAGAAVWGAMWLEDRARQNVRRVSIEAVAEAIVHLGTRAALCSFSNISLETELIGFEQETATFEAVRSNADLGGFGTRNGATIASYWLPKIMDEVRQAVEDVRSGKVTELEAKARVAPRLSAFASAMAALLQNNDWPQDAATAMALVAKDGEAVAAVANRLMPAAGGADFGAAGA